MKNLNGKRILIVDDEELLREILMEDLAHFGAEVLGAENGTSAFEMVRKYDFDAVITDIRMPGGSGLDLIKEIKAYPQLRRPKIFVCSGYNDVSISEIESLEVTHTFKKPFDREYFIQVISEKLAEKNS